MATVQSRFGCEFVTTGPPEPTELFLSVRETDQYEHLGVTADALLAGEHVAMRFTVLRDGWHLFLRELRHLHDAVEGEAVLADWDSGDTFIRFRVDDKARQVFSISLRQYSVITTVEPDPEEKEFFRDVWAMATGVRGLRIDRRALAEGTARLEAAPQLR